MNGKFLLRGTDFAVEVEVKPEDRHLVPEVACRKAFIEEAIRRLGAVNLGDWQFQGVVDASDERGKE